MKRAAIRILEWLAIPLFACVLLPARAPAQDGTEGPFSGAVGIAAKYDSNVDLGSGSAPPGAEEDDEIEDAWIAELTALLAYVSPWDSPWHLDLDASALVDVFVRDADDTWLIGRGRADLGYTFGDNSIGLQDEIEHYTEPDDTEFDYVRNTAALDYARVISALWQARVRYENIVHAYPDAGFYDYVMHGGFAQIRNTWTPALLTYYLYGYQFYLGQWASDESDPRSSPEKGARHTGEIGVEAIVARRSSIIAAYVFQLDQATGGGASEIGEIRGEDENLESDAEFNFLKHKGLVLFTHKFDKRFVASFYGEVIYKRFFERDDSITDEDAERTDLLYLVSAGASVRLVGELWAKARYVYRANESTAPFQDFRNHIALAGLEFRF
ncbi:hypothetical protein K8I61_07620 [bacterium]|nr:hypothetical protein [bacterium]